MIDTQKRGHVIVALRRVSANKGENIGLTKSSIRMIVKESVDETLNRLKKRVGSEQGVWRFYRSVNERDFEEARKALICDLVTRPELASRVDSHWKSLLMTSKCAASKLKLVDVDNPNEKYQSQVLEYLNKFTIERKDKKTKEKIVEHLKIIETRKTPNGLHVVTERFDTRELIKLYGDVEIKDDALLFLEALDNEIES